MIDNRLSRYWVFAQVKSTNTVYSRWAFPEWAEDPYFYNNLIEGHKKEHQLFSDYIELMDLEFPDPEVTAMAQIGDNEWLICPTCSDAWLSLVVQDAIVVCPKCRHKLNNPRYPWDKESKGDKIRRL